MKSKDEINLIAVGAHWDQVSAENNPKMIQRWWQADPIVHHINQRVCGEPLPGQSEGFNRLIQQRFADRLPFENVVSIGGGMGDKEMRAMEVGLFGRVDLFEIAKSRIEQGRAKAVQRDLAQRITFHFQDAFATNISRRYDAVYWNNALHHMPDVEAAIDWSYEVLKPGGAFLMDDYVGANRFQWSNRMLEANLSFWDSLPENYRQDPESGALIPPPSRTDPMAMATIDPSEATDSERILPAIKRTFPTAEVILTGGGVYHWALNDVVHNILAADDMVTLTRALALDDELIRKGETHYAVVLAVKQAKKCLLWDMSRILARRLRLRTLNPFSN